MMAVVESHILYTKGSAEIDEETLKKLDLYPGKYMAIQSL
jgi:aspartate 1-decarboxylase